MINSSETIERKLTPVGNTRLGCVIQVPVKMRPMERTPNARRSEHA
jgi:hypothetical protein